MIVERKQQDFPPTFPAKIHPRPALLDSAFRSVYKPKPSQRASISRALPDTQAC